MISWHLNVSLNVFLHYTGNCGIMQNKELLCVCVCVCMPSTTQQVGKFPLVYAGASENPHLISGHSPATYFHGNKSIMPDIMDFILISPPPPQFCHTQRRTNTRSKGNSEACGSLQSRTRGIKNRDGSRIYKYGGGSKNLSLSGSPIRTVTMLYERTMIDIQLKHNSAGERECKFN